MPNQKLEFGYLLSEGILSVANRQRKKIGKVEQEIGEELGFTRHTVQHWRRGYIPANKIVRFLLRYCTDNGHVAYLWARKFLKQAKYPDAKVLLSHSFPSHLRFFLIYQPRFEAQSLALELAQGFIDQGNLIFFNLPRILDAHQKEMLLERFKKSDYVICLLSPASLRSQPVYWLLEMAFELSQATKNGPQLLPVWLGGTIKHIDELPSGALSWAIWQNEGDTRRLMAELEQAAMTGSPLSLMSSTLAQLCEAERQELRAHFISPFAPLSRVRLYLSYKEGLDQPIVWEVAKRLDLHDYDIFFNRQHKINQKEWKEREKKLNQADYVIFFFSSEAISSEVVLKELDEAQKLRFSAKKPRLLAVWLASGPPLTLDVPKEVAVLNDWSFWQNESDTPRLIAELNQAISADSPLPFRFSSLVKLCKDINAQSPISRRLTRQLYGALPPDSPFYIERKADRLALKALKQKHFTLTVKAPRQMGKSSLLQRLAQQAAQVGKRFIWLDCRLFNKAGLEASSFFHYFCNLLTFKLGLANQLSAQWQFIKSPLDCTDVVAQEILPHLKRPCILAFDGSESLFDAPYRSDFFAMLRTWHNSRATSNSWQALNLIVATSTEPHCFIENLNQSPFNVGQVLQLQDLTLEQVADLNERYGEPLRAREVEQLMILIQGQPYLIQRALYLVANQRYSPQRLFQEASHEQGPFADHLRALFWWLSAKEDLRQAMRQVIRGYDCSDELFSRLQGAGLLCYGKSRRVEPRCKLYLDFFKQYY